MQKPILWLVLSEMENPAAPAVIPTVAWMAKRGGALVECYLEAERDGQLFAEHGSTVLGGAHHLQFNYLHQVFDVRAVLFGQPRLFMSSLHQFRTPILAEATTPADLYEQLADQLTGLAPERAVIIPSGPVEIGDRTFSLAPYCFPEICYREALGFTEADERGAYTALPATSFFAGEGTGDKVAGEDSIGSVTLRIARRWRGRAQGVVFGDPPAVLSQLASHCREERVAVYGPIKFKSAREIVAMPYAENASEIAEEAAELAVEVGNRVMVGRQTGDGDLFAWSRRGVCLQIVDPNRPVFPVVAHEPQRWAEPEVNPRELEPSDEELWRYAQEGKVLVTLLAHSGEVAHNEAMLNFCELASRTGLRMGLATHAQRYETCPQLWELLTIRPERGGVCGLIEPVLHSGGWGVMAESECPPELLAEHCRRALDRIREIAGEAGTPRGYYAFCDTDLATLSTVRGDTFDAVAGAGLEYFISSARPARNQILHRRGDFVALNQTCRSVCSSSPFVRVSGPDTYNTAAKVWPGWVIATLDAPVVSFLAHIWEKGNVFAELVEQITGPDVVNVTPHVIARYARVLEERGCLPPTGWSEPACK